MVAVLASSGGDQISLWNVPGDAIPIDSFTPQSNAGGGINSSKVTSLCWNKAAQILAASTACGMISVYSQRGSLQDILKPDSLISGNRETPVSCVSFSSNAQSICSGGSDGILRLWDCKRKEIVKLFQGHRAPVTCVAFNDRDEGLLSASCCGDLLLHEISSGSVVSLNKNADNISSKAINALQYSPFKKGVAGVACEDCVVQLWDTTRGVAVSQFNQHKAAVKGISFSPVNELLLCSAGLDKLLLFYDVQTNKLVKTISCEAPLESLDFMNDGFTVAAGTSTGYIVVYDLRTLGSGTSQSLSFAAHAPLPVTSLQFQHAPSSRSRGKPRQIGKENAQPHEAVTAPPHAESTQGVQPRAQSRPSEYGGSGIHSHLQSDSNSRTLSTPAQVSRPADFPHAPGLSSSYETFLPSAHQVTATFSPSSRLSSPADALHEKDIRERHRSSLDASARKGVSNELYASAQLTDSKVANAKDAGTRSADRSSEELLRELDRIRQERSQLVSDPSSKSYGAGNHRPESAGKDRSSIKPGGFGESFQDVHSIQPVAHQHDMPKRAGQQPSGLASISTTPVASCGHSMQRGITEAASVTVRADHSHTSQSTVQHGTPTADMSKSLTSPILTHGIAEPTAASRISSGGRSLGNVEDVRSTLKGLEQASPATDAFSESNRHNSAFPRELLPLVKSLLEDSLESFRDSVRADIQNLHVDMLRQFHLQQRELKEELALYAATNAELREELSMLREQTRLLSYLH